MHFFLPVPARSGVRVVTRAARDVSARGTGGGEVCRGIERTRTYVVT
jgi:hypothetical protein